MVARPAVFAGLLLALGFAGAGAGAPVAEPPTAPPAAEPEPYAAALDVSLRTLDVMVTNASGDPVVDLAPEDFELSIDGKPVALDHVDRPMPGSAVVTPTTMAIFLDESSLTGPLRSRSLELLSQALASGPGEASRVLVAAGRGGVLEILLAPTSDPAAVRSALAAAQAHPPVSSGASELRQILTDLSGASNPDADADDPVEARVGQAERAAILAEIRQYVLHRQTESLQTLAVLDRLIEALGSVAGRRSLLVLSGGLAAHPGEGPAAAWMRKFRDSALRDGAHRPQLEQGDNSVQAALDEVGRRANRAHVRLYGLSLVDDGPRADVGGRVVPALEQPQGEHAGAGESLAGLAQASGGLLLRGAGATAALLRTVHADDVGAYTLAWSPDGPGAAGGDVRVTVRRADLAVRYAAAPPAPAADGGLGASAVGAALFGAAANPLDVTLQVEAAADAPPTSAAPKDQHVVHLLVTLPLARLTLAPDGHVHRGSLRIAFAALDGNGRIAEASAVAVPIRIANEQLAAALGGLATYRAQLAVRPVSQRLAVSVHDDLGGTSAAATVAWEPEGTAAPGSATGRP